MAFKKSDLDRFGEYVTSSRRKVTNFVNLNKMLKPGAYLVVCVALNHWGGTEILDPAKVPKGILTVHSAKPVLVEKFKTEPVLLADSLIATVLARGKRHGVSLFWIAKMKYLHCALNPARVLFKNCRNANSTPEGVKKFVATQ